jgi:hypothetical protein
MESPEVLTELSSGLGPELTRWSARLVAGCWVAWLILSVAGAGASRRRLLFTAGLIGQLVHVFCAFHFIHRWSHAEAVLHTARLTERVIGWGFGQGVWVNYAFTLTWLIVAGSWWSRPAEMSWPRGFQLALHGFFAFLFVNATVVFGPWWWKLVGAAVLVGVGVAWRIRRASVSAVV